MYHMGHILEPQNMILIWGHNKTTEQGAVSKLFKADNGAGGSFTFIWGQTKH